MSTCNRPLSLCKSYNREQFWMDDVKELFKDKKYFKFFPKYEMTRTEQLNAITRFLIYFILLVLLFGKSDTWLYVPITGLVIIAIMYNVHRGDDKGKRKELDRILNIRGQQREEKRKEKMRQLRHDGDESYKLDIEEEKPDYTLEVGNIDSEGHIRVGPKTDPPKSLEKEDSLYTIDELVDYQKNTCRRPTRDNPMMNTIITDFNNPDVPPAACNADDNDISDEARVTFNQDLFRDVDDLWEKKNSQRQFYTVPNTAVPNNQKEFAMWLYGTGSPNCKTDGEKCLRYENLRFGTRR